MKEPLILNAKVLEVNPVEKIDRVNKPAFIKQRILYDTPCGEIIVDAIGSKVRMLEEIYPDDMVRITFFFSANRGHNNHTLKSIEKL
jgi:hypothetical protein